MKPEPFSVTDQETIAEYKGEVWRLKKKLEISINALQEIANYKAETLTDQYYALARLAKIASTAIAKAEGRTE